MVFEAFLTHSEKIFNIYNKEGDPMLDNDKVKFLFKISHHLGLKITIEALKTMHTTGTAVTHTMAVNHLYTEVSQLREYPTNDRNISALFIGSN